MTDRQKKLIENYVRTKVRSMLKEENSETIPKNVTFNVINSFKQMKQMMGILEGVCNDDTKNITTFWETYDNVLESLRKKLDQMEVTANRSR